MANRMEKRDTTFVKRILGHFLDGKNREFELWEKFCQFSDVTMASTGTLSKEQWDISPLYRPALSRFRTNSLLLFNCNRPETSSYCIYTSFDVVRLGTHWGEFIRGIYFENDAIWIPNISHLLFEKIIVTNDNFLDSWHWFSMEFTDFYFDIIMLLILSYNNAILFAFKPILNWHTSV